MTVELFKHVSLAFRVPEASPVTPNVGYYISR